MFRVHGLNIVASLKNLTVRASSVMDRSCLSGVGRLKVARSIDSSRHASELTGMVELSAVGVGALGHVEAFTLVTDGHQG